ncbi:MAG: hypothetical protein CVU06_05170 [Bacteroidetes bacterium HGW-Bacteroidetes-22]|nr:MAG: hypothetical protein CVU06_05170 [Bacteroidetes bacterium HGW-Bacteroidetes-22]
MAWLVVHPERGFVVISADSILRPVLAYGDVVPNQSPKQFSAWKILLASDYNGRLDAISEGSIPSEKMYWKESPRTPFQQWPPEGSTVTGGWLFTNWTQSSPYNKFCPMDLNAGSRSYVGCPATVMAQIFNYNRSLNFTRFDDTDDYYHSYGAGNQYWIDNDYAVRKFPSFPELNVWLDTLEKCYTNGYPTTDSMHAALSFATGVAAHQVYTASGSGTFGVDQAYMAILRFGFDQAELLMPPDTSINARVAEDMKNAMPAHLAVVDETNTTGHNVVIDGYNTDEFYHFNFGWGGSANGWYTLPPASMPYNLTVIEGVVVRIRSTYAGIGQASAKSSTVTFSSPERTKVAITGLESGNAYTLQLYNAAGSLACELRFEATAVDQIIATGPLAPGLYVCRLTARGQQYNGKVVML